MDLQGIPLHHNHKAFVDRFVNACIADERVVAAFLGGSYAKGYSDPYSDIDLCVITTDQSFEEFVSQREAFLRSLGDLVFHEDFGNPEVSFYIYAEDTEGELNDGRESGLDKIHSGPFKILVDKTNILAGAIFSPFEPSAPERVEKLRHLLFDFWHELSHFMIAMQRNQLWWARGQLESLRSVCVNLARLRNNFLDPEFSEEAYFKIETVMPVEKLSALVETFCPMEKEAMLKAGSAVVQFYREIAPLLAILHGIEYPSGLERVMMDRWQKLQAAQVQKENG